MHQTIKNNPVWDKANSTYMRLINLENGVTLTGYSKKVGRNERKDKIDLLTNWILRDFKSGYLNKRTTNGKITTLDKIDYYSKIHNQYEPVITLTYNHPEWVNPKWMEIRKFYVFIQRFYDFIYSNRDESFIINALEVRTRTHAIDPLDLSVFRFATVRDLNSFTDRLKQQQEFPQEAIEHFYREYLNKYQNKFQKN